MKNLYIIGNGFDCHHCINSSYKAYKEWLKINHTDLYKTMSNYYEVDNVEWWGEFELNLGEIDLSNYIELMSLIYQPDFSRDDLRDRNYLAGSYQAEAEIGKLVNDIKDTFQEWIKSLPKANSAKKIKLEAGSDDFFINFNYTLTLQQLYDIPDAQILHIHGNIRDEKFILGHNKTYDKLHEKAYNGNRDDYITDTVRDAAVNEVYSIRKNVDQIIRNNHQLFSSLEEVEQIYIFGFSFSPIDQLYIDELIKHINQEKVLWKISHYTHEDKNRIEDYMKLKRISPSLWKPLIQLEDIKINRQLKI